jgi:hypothetical protein
LFVAIGDDLASHILTLIVNFFLVILFIISIWMLNCMVLLDLFIDAAVLLKINAVLREKYMRGHHAECHPFATINHKDIVEEVL